MKQQFQQVSESLIQKDSQAKDASEEVELTLLQLHQVQEELEYYFLLCRRQAEMLTSSENLAQRASALISSIVR